MKMLFGVTLALMVSLFTSVALADTTSDAAGRLMKKIILPVAIATMYVDGAHAYEQHCTHVPESDQVSCAAGAFTEHQLNELGLLMDDVRIVMTYQVIPALRDWWNSLD